MRQIRHHRRRARGRRTRRMFCAGILLLLLLIFGRPLAHVAWVAWRDREAPPASTPAGFISDASRMQPIAIARLIELSSEITEAEAQLRDVLRQAREQHIPVSIAGARHTMGGHIAAPEGLVIDMLPLNQIELGDDGVLHAQAGARWSQIIPFLDQRGRSIEVMQSNNSFTVGGSISANCHGWQPNHAPIASTVLALRLMKADGSIVACSRAENPELFALVLGGYGLFGIILDADIRTVPNERYEMRRFVIDAREIVPSFDREARNRADVGMAYGRLCVSAEEFLGRAVLNIFIRSPGDVPALPPAGEHSLTAWKRTVFRGSAGSDYGKRLRWDAELLLSDRLAQSIVSRNMLLNDPVEWYQDRSAQTTDILHEYFVPPQRFNDFLARLREIIPRHSMDLLNATVRHVLTDEDSFLRYADGELFSLVLLFNQPRTFEADADMQSLARELIDAALECGGRYYLPYRLHATQAQFERAYPQATGFFEKKREHDPENVFQNQFYLKYGR